MTGQDAEDSPKQPDIRLVIEFHQREDKRAIEIVSARVEFLPSLPFFPVPHPDLKRLILLIRPREMDLVILRGIDRPDIAQEDCQDRCPLTH